MDKQSEAERIAAALETVAQDVDRLMERLGYDHPAQDALSHVTSLLEACGEYLTRLPD
jgi:hypothetical protein